MPDAVILDVLLGWNRSIERAAGGFADLMDHDESTARAARVDSAGDPVEPCLKLSAGRWRLLWPVDPGARQISVQCRYSGPEPRPYLVIERNPNLGVASDVVVTAGPSTDWQRLEATVNVSDRGVLVVWLVVPVDYVLWDTVAAG